MNMDVKAMLDIYQTYEYDWLGEPICDVDKLTRHHIIKIENGGENGISNYALLTSQSHNFVNYLEENDTELYNKVNYMFYILNRSSKPVTEEYYDVMHNLLIKYKNSRRKR